MIGRSSGRSRSFPTQAVDPDHTTVELGDQAAREHGVPTAQSARRDDDKARYRRFRAEHYRDTPERAVSGVDFVPDRRCGAERRGMSSLRAAGLRCVWVLWVRRREATHPDKGARRLFALRLDQRAACRHCVGFAHQAPAAPVGAYRVVMPARPRMRFSMRWWLALVFAGIAALTAVVVAQVFRSSSESAIRDRAAELTAGTAVAGASRVAAAPNGIAARRIATDVASRRRIALFVFDEAGRLLTSDRVAEVDLGDVRDLESALAQRARRTSLRRDRWRDRCSHGRPSDQRERAVRRARCICAAP